MHLIALVKQLLYAILIVALSAWLAACGEVTGNPDSRFVALDSVFDHQVRLLESLDPKVKKWAVTEGREEVQVFQNINWQKELAVFRQADISKPGLRGAYTVENLTPQVWLFKLKPGENAEVQELRIVFTDKNQIASVEALINDKNYLYHTRQTFRIHFADRANNWVVDSYQMEGVQKLLLNQEQSFAIRAEVL